MPVSDASLVELVTDLSQNLRTLFRQEIALARAEIAKNVSRATRSAGMIAAGAVLGYAGLLAFIATACLALVALGLSPLVASLIVTVAFCVLGFVLVRLGLSRLRATSLAPTTTVETLRESAETLKGATR